jgi:hypothetical protein
MSVLYTHYGDGEGVGNTIIVHGHTGTGSIASKSTNLKFVKDSGALTLL